jgi:hypothetical protein
MTITLEEKKRQFAKFFVALFAYFPYRILGSLDYLKRRAAIWNSVLRFRGPA